MHSEPVSLAARDSVASFAMTVEWELVKRNDSILDKGPIVREYLETSLFVASV